MSTLCSHLDSAGIARMMMTILCRKYINEHKRYMMKEELSVSLVLRFLNLNVQKMKKVQILKEFITKILDCIQVNACDDLDQLTDLRGALDQNLKMLLKSDPKIDEFQSRLNRRIMDLEEIYAEADSVIAMQREPEIEETLLSQYFEDHIADAHMNRVHDGDREVVDQRKVWLQIVPEKVRLQAEKESKLKKESMMARAEEKMPLSSGNSSINSSAIKKKHVKIVEPDEAAFSPIEEVSEP